MEISGKVIAVQPIQTGEGKNGQWRKQEYVIEYDSNPQYPHRMMFNLWGEKIDQYHMQEGQSVRVSYEIECREYNGRWYNDIRAWKIETEDGTPVAETSGFVQAQPTSLMPNLSQTDETSDLPF